MKMPRKRKYQWSTISLPAHLIEELKEYGHFGESWPDLMKRLMKNSDDLVRLKERYRFKKS
jgi:hypothetical protein